MNVLGQVDDAMTVLKTRDQEAGRRTAARNGRASLRGRSGMTVGSLKERSKFAH